MLNPKKMYDQWKSAGTRVVACPDNREPAALEVRGPGGQNLAVVHCTRWPEKETCGQECLAQIAAAPDGCRFPKIFESWFREQDCALCGRPLKETSWLDHRPALLGPDGVTIEWKDVGPEVVVKLMETYQACCWNCHIAEEFRRKRPDLVTDREFKKQ